MSREPEILVSDDPAARAAERLARAAATGGHVALAGGSTPRAAYEQAPALAGDWSRATFWFGDERCVPPDHEHSNYRMAKEAMLDRLAAPVPDVRRIEGELPPSQAAVLYERALAAAFAEGPPELDLALMGLGPDAHTASLFPGDDVLDEEDRLVTAVESPRMEPLVPRVTMTVPVLRAAREVVFLVAGEDKAEAVRRAFAGPPDREVPASLIRPEHGSLTVLLDPAAASRLAEGREGHR